MVPARKRAITPRTLTRGTTRGYASKDQYNGSYIPTLYSIRRRRGRQPAKRAVNEDGKEETITKDEREREEEEKWKEGSVVAALGMAAAIRSSGLAPWRLGGCRLVRHVTDLRLA